MSVRTRISALALPAICLTALVCGPPVATAAPGEVTSYRIPGCLLSAAPPDITDFVAAPTEGVTFRACDGGGRFGDGDAVLERLLPSGKTSSRTIGLRTEGPILSVAGGKAVGAEVVSGATPNDLGVEMERVVPGRGVETVTVPTPTEYAEPQIFGPILDASGDAWIAIGEPVGGYVSASNSTGGQLVRWATDGTVSSFRVPGEVEPQGLTLGPDGNIWFTGIEGRVIGEHSQFLGRGYVGRVTPAGEFDLHRIPGRPSEGGEIAPGPDGDLWFVEAPQGSIEVARIGTDGSLDRPIHFHYGFPLGPIAFDPEGNLWLSLYEAELARITPTGHETVYHVPIEAPSTVLLGAEGDIWARTWKEARRIVPGGPGIDVQGLRFDRGSRTIDARLACGGSRRACRGTFSLAVPRSGPAGSPEKRRFEPFATVRYRINAESRRRLRVAVPDGSFAVPGRRPAPYGEDHQLYLLLRATVTGGPTLRRLLVPKIVGRARDAR